MTKQLKVEQMMMNAWPALHTVDFEGWKVCFTCGYTKRANSVYPLHDQTTGVSDWAGKIDAVERMYAEQGLPSIFKMTDEPRLSPLDHQLSASGYEKEGATAVMTCSLANVSEPAKQTVEMSLKPTDRWLARYAEMSGSSKLDMAVMQQMLARLEKPACFVILYEGNQDVACGYAVLEDGYTGLYSIVTAPAYRNQGYGEQLVLNLLKWAKLSGATEAYLAVVLDNAPAVRLYGKVGFAEAYRYWYRLKPVATFS
ncbi:acetyltransferase (GNAT) family protein [Paenibacillus cellulosilyticus]|uniref:Acetyltransferase (GNAT) family protein n=1 Tax=Paenibacillus cellulosilyticus TaxID=375489 RepID=A0A2V2YTM2_9BACL|nr:GNAT family N-acetyltransferase [Paenibacillus cellulosilyticus]PWW02461.1 acetyltransferase (GNAT) family protein [Paenibacillus cellulosilyticus]QKS47167.1 GNAT family N-acetyltransferase [Paenibacillus cellulosilyticus]